MVVIDLCLLKLFYWKNSVPQTKKHHRHLFIVAKIMICFTIIFLDDIKQDADTTASHRKIS